MGSPVGLVAVAPVIGFLLVDGSWQRLQIGEVVAVRHVVDVHEHAFGPDVIQSDIGFGNWTVRVAGVPRKHFCDHELRKCVPLFEAYVRRGGHGKVVRASGLAKLVVGHATLEAVVACEFVRCHCGSARWRYMFVLLPSQYSAVLYLRALALASWCRESICVLHLHANAGARPTKWLHEFV